MMQLIAICIVALTFGFVGSMPLAGPIAVFAISRATLKRYDEALRIGLGAAAAEGIYAGVAFWGYTTFLARQAVVVPISDAATAVVLLAVGIRFVAWKPSQSSAQPERRAGTVLVGFSVSALNPTLFVTWSAAVAFMYSKGLTNPPAIFAIPFGLSSATGIAAWFVALTALLRRFGGKLPTRFLTWTVRAMGLVLVGLGVWSGVQLIRLMKDARSRYAGDGAHATCLPLPHRGSSSL